MRSQSGAMLAEREVVRRAVDLPRRAAPARTGRPSGRRPPRGSSRSGPGPRSPAGRRCTPGDRLGDQVVVLGGLQRDGRPRPAPRRARAPTCRRSCTTYSALDVAAASVRHAGDPRRASVRMPGDGDALDDPGAPRRGRPWPAPWRHVDRVGPAVVGDVEAGEHVVDPGEREQLGDLGGEISHVDAEAALERRARGAGPRAARACSPGAGARSRGTRSSARSRPRAGCTGRGCTAHPGEVSSAIPALVIRPAACQVVPDVSWSRSSSRTSVTPSAARW